MARFRRSAVQLAKTLNRQPLVGVEIGVEKGELSVQLLKECNWTLFYLIDPWATYAESHPYYQSGDRLARLTIREQNDNYQKTKEAVLFAGEKVRILRDFSFKVVNQIEEIDFIFLDANHTYESVKRDLEQWWPKVKSGGIFSGHDYGSINEFRGKWGVKRAVHDFFDPQNLEVNLKPGKVWWVKKS